MMGLISCGSLPLSLCMVSSSDLQSVTHVIGSARILASISMLGTSRSTRIISTIVALTNSAAPNAPAKLC
eukprot:5932026-Pyramimonas_sp.AAC.1